MINADQETPHQRLGMMLATAVEARSPSPLDAARIVQVALLAILSKHLGDQGMLHALRTVVATLEAPGEPVH